MNLATFIIIDIIAGVILFAIITYIMRTSSSIKIEKRISDYALTSIHDSQLSFFDRTSKIIWKFIHKTGLIITKPNFMQKYSLYYNRYLSLNNGLEITDYLSLKLIIGILFLVMSIVTPIFSNPFLKGIYYSLTFIIGFMSVDFYFNHKFKQRKKKIDDDLIKSIILLNNAFRSNSSITQAIASVSTQLSGPISVEYKKIARDLAYGLSLEDAFERFYDRVEIEEINFITTTLITVRKNGGNVIEAFEFIEKDFINNRSNKVDTYNNKVIFKLVYKASLLTPIITVVLLTIFKRTYFKILFNSIVGGMIVSIMILLYILYILIINRLIEGDDL